MANRTSTDIERMPVSAVSSSLKNLRKKVARDAEFETEIAEADSKRVRLKRSFTAPTPDLARAAVDALLEARLQVRAEKPKRGPRAAEDKGKPSTREKRLAMTLYYPPEVRKTLKQLALDEETTVQSLVGEAIDLLLVSRGQQPLKAR